MNDLLQIASADLAQFLGEHLPRLSAKWWETNVVARLSFQQQRWVSERDLSSLDQLDFAALLRVLDQNWRELSGELDLPREARNWVKELQTVRNRWSHQAAAPIPASRLYRDSETLGFLIGALAPESKTIAKVEETQQECLVQMAAEKKIPQGIPAEDLQSSTDSASDVTENDGPRSSRHEFKAQDVVVLRSDPEGMPFVVMEVHSGPKEVEYEVFREGKFERFFESQLSPAIVSGAMASSRADADELKAYLTGMELLSPSTVHLFSLRSGRIAFIPYQYRPVLRLLRGDRPRLLIADEVGVGKTIEAGLIIKELRARSDISSILVICTKTLVSDRKWLLEMERFDEHFTHLDGPMLRHCLNETHLDGEWPVQYEKAIVPFSLFDSELLFGPEGKRKRNREGLLALDPPPKFDLVIVDEAHYLRNSETFRHQGVRYFCDNAEAVLFLTATPVQLGSDDLFTLLNVLRPDLVIDQPSFEQMAEPNKPINASVAKVRAAKPGWQGEARSELDAVARTDWGRRFVCESPAFQEIYDSLGESEISDQARIDILRGLEELYTFSPMINRTRRRDIGTFTTRKPETLTVEFTPDQQGLHDDLLELVDRILAFLHGRKNIQFMMTTLRRQAASSIYGLAPLLESILAGKLERLEMAGDEDSDVQLDVDFSEEARSDITALLESASRLDTSDPKLDAFLRVLETKADMPKNKALVFSTFRHTLAYLEKQLRRKGTRFGLIHGSVKDEERVELRRRFALSPEDSKALDVLLSSEVGCEGLDFQHCDLLINYDLPWNPMRIEQRIGRIDRYGQDSETVAIVNLVTPGTVDADIYERCLWRIGVFETSVGGNEAILGQVTQQIHDIAESYHLTPRERNDRLQQLADNAIRELREEQILEEKQADLFGLSLPGQSWRKEIEDAESSWLSETALQRCVENYLSKTLENEGEYILGRKSRKTLRLNEAARSQLLPEFPKRPRSNDPVARRWEKWLKGTAATLPVTFNQETAAADPGVVHLGVLHPLVRQAARAVESLGPVKVSVKSESEEIAPGEYPFSIYRWKKLGIRPDESLVAVSTSEEIEARLMILLAHAEDDSDGGSERDFPGEVIDHRHYESWSAARANHIAKNRDTVDHRSHSLRASHEARRSLLTDQIGNATDEKIRTMKEHELARADKDYDRQVAELNTSVDRADLHAVLIASGFLRIARVERASTR